MTKDNYKETFVSTEECMIKTKTIVNYMTFFVSLSADLLNTSNLSMAGL